MKLFEPEYSESSHTYTEPGSRKTLPSVTQVCELAYRIRPDFRPEAAARGHKRHLDVARAITAYMNGNFAVADGNGPGAAAVRLLKDMGAEPVYVERAMYSPSLLYAGRADLIAKIDNRLTIIDWKGHSDNPVYYLQIAGYAIMAAEILNIPVRHGIIVNWIGDREQWRPRILPDNPEHLIPGEHVDAFMACLSLWHWQQRNVC